MSKELKAEVVDIQTSQYNGKQQFAIKVKFINEERNWDVERMVFLDASFKENETLMKGIEFKKGSSNNNNRRSPKKDFRDVKKGGNNSGKKNWGHHKDIKPEEGMDFRKR